jgi:tape measure domain-containing protein
MGYTASQGAVISVSVDGAAASQRQIDGLAQSMGNLSNMVQGAMRNLAATAGLGGGLAAIIQQSDEYAKLTSQLHLATQSQREYAAAYGDVKRIAAAAQSDLAGTGVLYARIANGTRELGTSQKQVADITEAVNLGLKVSGATAEESASAQLQLSQAFASGALRGEEFNAVNDAAPRIMKALADGMGVSVGALKQMASEGKITSQIMADVLPQALEKLRAEAAQVQTIGGAFTNLKSNVLEFTAISAQSNGTVALLTGGINLLANNLTLVAGALATVTAVKAATWLQTWTVETYNKIAADQASRTATLAAAQADLARVQATGAQAAATQAAVVVAREEMAARLGQANANIAAAEAAITAASAAGAQSFALRTLRLATGELAAAETARSAALAELAILGQQQVRISAQIAAAREAEAVATGALSAAQAGAAVTAGLATRALGLVGGPLGAIVAVLGTAATAWSWYASKAKEGSQVAAESYEEAHQRIVKGLDEQIAKNEKLIQLQNLGMSKKEIDRSAPVLDQMAAASRRLDDINNRTGQFASSKSDYELMQARAKVMQDIIELTAKLQKEEQGAHAVAVGDTEALVAVRERLLGVDKQYLDDLAKLATAREKGAIGEQEYISLVSKLATETYKKSEAGKAAEKQSKASAAATRSEAEAYQDLLDKIHGKADGQSADFQQNLAILYKGYQAGKQSLAEYTATVETYIGQQKSSIELERARVKALEEVASFNKAYSEGLAATSGILAKSVEEAQREAEQNERLAATFGMTKAAIEAQQLARLEEQLAQRASTGLTLDEITALEQLIAAKRRSADALANLDTQEANKRAFDQMVADAKRSSEQIGQSLTDEIMRGGKSGAEYLEDLFRTMVLRPTIQAVMSPVSQGIAAAFGPSAGATAGATAGSSAGGSMLGSAAAGLFGAGGLTGSLAAGAGWLTGATTLGGSLTAGASLMGTGTLAGMASGLGMMAGALGPIALGVAAIYALTKSIDHSGTPHTGGAASASASGTSVIAAESLHFEKTATSAATEQWVSGIASGVVSILNSTATAFGKTAGYEAATAFADDSSKDGAWGGLVIKNLGAKLLDWQDTRGSGPWAPKLFADGDAGQQQYLAEISKSVRSVMDGIGLPEWAGKLLDDLGDAPALDELAKVVDTINATESALVIMGQRLAGFSGLSDSAVSALMSASGGIETLAANASTYYDAFYSESEKTAVVTDQVAQALQKVGLAMPATNQDFRALVESQMQLGEAGAPALAALFGVAGAFAQLHPALEATAAAGRSAADILSERTGLLDQLAQLTMTPDAYARSKLDPSNIDAYEQVQAAQKAKDAAEALAATNQSYDDQINAILKGRMTESELIAAETAGMDASTLARYNRLAGLKAEDEANAKAKASADALAQTNQGYQDQIDAILRGRMSEAELIALDTAGMADSTRALYDRLAALKAEDAAAEAWAQRKAAIEAAGQQAEADRVAAAQAASQALQAIANQRTGMELNLYNLTHNAADQLAHKRELELAALDATLRPMQLQIYAAEDMAAAMTTAAQEIEKAKAKAEAVASERAGLDREYYQLTGDTAKLREIELAGLDETNRARKQEIYDLQDKQALDKKAADAAQAFANAQVQAVLASQKAADDLKNAWQGITDTISDEVARIRGLASGSSTVSLAAAQSQFTIATAQARAGDQDAAKLLPSLSKTLLDLAQSNAATALELRRIQGATAASLVETGGTLAGRFKLALPGFAVGTNYLPGDMPIIAHAGERIIPAADNRALMARLSSPAGNNDALLDEVRRLNARMQDAESENAKLRELLAAALPTMARNIMQTRDIMKKFDTIGMPKERVAA